MLFYPSAARSGGDGAGGDGGGGAATPPACVCAREVVVVVVVMKVSICLNSNTYVTHLCCPRLLLSRAVGEVLKLAAEFGC